MYVHLLPLYLKLERPRCAARHLCSVDIDAIFKKLSYQDNLIRIPPGYIRPAGQMSKYGWLNSSLQRYGIHAFKQYKQRTVGPRKSVHITMNELDKKRKHL
jgi:hypothetical protein